MRTRRSKRKQSRQVGKGLHRTLNIPRYSTIWCYYDYNEAGTKIKFVDALQNYITQLMNSNNPIVKEFKKNKLYNSKLPESVLAKNRNANKEDLLNKLVQKVRNAHQFRSSFRSCNGYSKATAEEVENIDKKIKELIEP